MRSEPSLTQRVWSTLRTTLIGIGLSEWLLRQGLLGLEETRRRLAPVSYTHLTLPTNREV